MPLYIVAYSAAFRLWLQCRKRLERAANVGGAGGMATYDWFHIFAWCFREMAGTMKEVTEQLCSSACLNTILQK